MNAIPTPVQTVLDLFATHLPAVRFGDLDAQSLARTAGEVQAAAEAVAVAQASLDSARGALHERQEAMLGQVQRALAYARVYAEADEELTARIDAVALPRGQRRSRAEPASSSPRIDELVLTEGPSAPRRQRGRPRKSPAPYEATVALPIAPTAEWGAQVCE